MVLGLLLVEVSEITLRHTTLDRTPLDEWSARCRDLYQTTHKHSQETGIHAPGGTRTRNPSKRTAADPRLRPRSHRGLFELYGKLGATKAIMNVQYVKSFTFTGHTSNVQSASFLRFHWKYCYTFDVHWPHHFAVVTKWLASSYIK
jgi:hypothetical protein